jgi:hypothetical protein
MTKETLLDEIRNAANIADSENFPLIASSFDDILLSVTNDDHESAIFSSAKAKKNAIASNNQKIIVCAEGLWDKIKNKFKSTPKSQPKQESHENWNRQKIDSSFFSKFKDKNGRFFDHYAKDALIKTINDLLSAGNTLYLTPSNRHKQYKLNGISADGYIGLVNEKPIYWNYLVSGKAVIEIDPSSKPYKSEAESHPDNPSSVP